MAALLSGAGVPPVEDEDEGEELDEEQMNHKMAEALALNEQLKAMVLQAERQQESRGPARHVHGGRQPVQSLVPPVAGRARNGGWGGVTHTERRSNEISRQNAILVSKLTNIATNRRPGTISQAPPSIPANRTTVAINRRKKDDQIARENAAMARRLNAVKPTAALSSKNAAKHAAQHSKYLQVLRPSGRLDSTMGMLPPSGPGAHGRPRTGQRQQLPSLTYYERQPFT